MIRDVDPAGIMSLTEHDIAVAKEASSCPACREKRIHTEEDWKHHPASAGTEWQIGTAPEVLRG